MKWENVLGGWSTSALTLVGAAILAPVILPMAQAIVRPVAKGLVVGGLALSNGLTSLVAQTSERVNDLVAEVQETRRAQAATGKKSVPH
jgi:hypothetical protein